MLRNIARAASGMDTPSFPPIRSPSRATHAAPFGDPAIFGHMTPDRIDRLSTLPYQQVASMKDQGSSLLLHAFCRYKPHVRPLDSFTNCFGIGGVILMTLH